MNITPVNNNTSKSNTSFGMKIDPEVKDCLKVFQKEVTPEILDAFVKLSKKADSYVMEHAAFSKHTIGNTKSHLRLKDLTTGTVIYPEAEKKGIKGFLPLLNSLLDDNFLTDAFAKQKKIDDAAAVVKAAEEKSKADFGKFIDSL